MKLLVLGASGGIGGWIVRVAAARGHDVTAVARPSSAWTAPEGVHVVRGEVSDGGFVREVTAGHDVVLSAFGLRRAAVVPWSRLLSSPDLVETVTRHLAEHLEGDTRGRGLHRVNDAVARIVTGSGVRTGLCFVFCRMSANLLPYAPRAPLPDALPPSRGPRTRDGRSALGAPHHPPRTFRYSPHQH